MNPQCHTYHTNKLWQKTENQVILIQNLIFYLIRFPIYQYQFDNKRSHFSISQYLLAINLQRALHSQHYYNKMSFSQIPEQSSNQYPSSSDIFDDQRIRRRQQERFYDEQTMKQFSSKFSQAVSNKIPSSELESNRKTFGCLLQRAYSIIYSLLQKMGDVKNDFEKFETNFPKNANSNERKPKKQIQNKNQSWSSEKSNNEEEMEQVEKYQKISLYPRKIKLFRQKRQSQKEIYIENEEDQYSKSRKIFANKQGVIVSNFSSTITVRDLVFNSKHNIQQNRQSQEQSQLLSQDIKMHINLDFCENLPEERKKGVQNKRYHTYNQQYTQRKRSNVGENQKYLPKSLNCIQQSTMKRQKSLIDKLDANPQLTSSEKLNYARRKIQSLFPQSESIDLGRMSEKQSKGLRRSGKEIVEVLVCSIEHQKIIGKLHGLDFHIHFSSIEKLVAESKKITILVQPIGNVLVRFSKKELPNKFVKALSSYLLGGN